MIEFTHKNCSVATIDNTAKYTLVRYKKNGKCDIVSSKELKHLEDEILATLDAMDSVKDYEESCDLFYFGEYVGTAKYVDLNPNSWFSNMQIVFSEVIY